jgi:methylphosphotriester-DNA--protein-cysteine methyltransferase
MLRHSEITDTDLRKRIKQKKICYGGNKKLKIYGTLKCKSGRRMKRENRVFFVSEKEAAKQGYRPCGHCMKSKYQRWKDGLI